MDCGGRRDANRHTEGPWSWMEEVAEIIDAVVTRAGGSLYEYEYTVWLRVHGHGVAAINVSYILRVYAWGMVCRSRHPLARMELYYEILLVDLA